MGYWSDELAGIGYVELASIDESEPYEIDVAEVYFDTNRREFVLRTASGCSCWDGDYDDMRFATFVDLKAHLLGDNTERYNPSLSGAIELLDEAERVHREKFPVGGLPA